MRRDSDPDRVRGDAVGNDGEVAIADRQSRRDVDLARMVIVTVLVQLGTRDSHRREVLTANVQRRGGRADWPDVRSRSWSRCRRHRHTKPPATGDRFERRRAARQPELADDTGDYFTFNPVFLEHNPYNPSATLPELDVQPTLPTGNWA